MFSCSSQYTYNDAALYVRKHHLRGTNTNFALKQIICSSIEVDPLYSIGIHSAIQKCFEGIESASLTMMMTACIYILA